MQMQEIAWKWIHREVLCPGEDLIVQACLSKLANPSVCGYSPAPRYACWHDSVINFRPQNPHTIYHDLSHF